MLFFTFLSILSDDYNTQINANTKIELDLESKSNQIHQIHTDLKQQLNLLSKLKQQANNKKEEITVFEKELQQVKDLKPGTQSSNNEQFRKFKNDELNKFFDKNSFVNFSLLKFQSDIKTLRANPANDILQILFPKLAFKGIQPVTPKDPYWGINGSKATASFRSDIKSKVKQIYFLPFAQKRCIPKSLKFTWYNNEFAYEDVISLPSASSDGVAITVQPKWFRNFKVSINETYGNDHTICLPVFRIYDVVSRFV